MALRELSRFVNFSLDCSCQPIVLLILFWTVPERSAITLVSFPLQIILLFSLRVTLKLMAQAPVANILANDGVTPANQATAAHSNILVGVRDPLDDLNPSTQDLVAAHHGRPVLNRSLTGLHPSIGGKGPRNYHPPPHSEPQSPGSLEDLSTVLLPPGAPRKAPARTRLPSVKVEDLKLNRWKNFLRSQNKQKLQYLVNSLHYLKRDVRKNVNTLKAGGKDKGGPKKDRVPAHIQAISNFMERAYACGVDTLDMSSDDSEPSSSSADE